MIYRYDKYGRRWATVVPVLVVWALVLAGVFAIDMVWWLGALVLAFTLPAIWDVVRDSHAWVAVHPGRIAWQSALRSGDRGDIDHVRLNRRFDGGVKITLIHIGGAQTRLPPDITPPLDAFEAALGEAGITAQRHPFSIL